MKIGVIDCGTNTFHLLIVRVKDGHYTILHKEKVVVKIGEGGINNKIITPEGIDRAMAALQHFVTVIRVQQPDKIHAFATSAFRNAENGVMIKEKIKQATGINIQIISGDEEARLIYEGVRSGLEITETSLIIDIGGGSVEFIIANTESILWKQSFEIGAQRLLDRFHKADPIPTSEINALEVFLAEALHPLLTQLEKHRPSTIIGCSGTFDTLSDIYCAENNITKDEDTAEVPLSITSYYAIHEELIHKNREERLVIPGMLTMRVDMIVVASCLVNYLLSKHVFSNIRVSTLALKEGALKEIVDASLRI